MNHFISVLPMLLTLIICVITVASMSSYRVPMKKAFLLFCVYFVLYHKYGRAGHRQIIEPLQGNWWLFSTVPLLFTVLIVMTNKAARIPEGVTRNYLLLLVIFVLMLLVYAIILYTFRNANAAMKSELAKSVYSQQLDAAKDQITFLNEAQMQTAIYRHNMRHNLATIDAFLSTEKVQQAREYIKEVQDGIEGLALKRFCQNGLVNLLCSSFVSKAERDDIRLTVDANLPEELKVSDMGALRHPVQRSGKRSSRSFRTGSVFEMGGVLLRYSYQQPPH